jgi:hypothetical protein
MSDKFQQSTFCNAKVGHKHVLCPHNAQKSFKSEREMFRIVEQEQGQCVGHRQFELQRRNLDDALQRVNRLEG